MMMCIETNPVKPMVMLMIDTDFSYFYISIFLYMLICVITFIGVNRCKNNIWISSDPV